MSEVIHIFRYLSLRERAIAALVNKVAAQAPCRAIGNLRGALKRSPEHPSGFPLGVQEWHHAAQHPSLWHTLNLQGCQDAAAVLPAVMASPVRLYLSRLKQAVPSTLRLRDRAHLVHAADVCGTVIHQP